MLVIDYFITGAFSVLFFGLGLFVGLWFYKSRYQHDMDALKAFEDSLEDKGNNLISLKDELAKEPNLYIRNTAEVRAEMESMLNSMNQRASKNYRTSFEERKAIVSSISEKFGDGSSETSDKRAKAKAQRAQMMARIQASRAAGN